MCIALPKMSIFHVTDTVKVDCMLVLHWSHIFGEVDMVYIVSFVQMIKKKKRGGDE